MRRGSQSNGAYLVHCVRIFNISQLCRCRCHRQRASVTPFNMAMLLNKIRNKVKGVDEQKRKDERESRRAGKPIKQEVPELRKFIDGRDYAGAISFLTFKQKNENYDPMLELWRGYCYFQARDMKNAQMVYEGMLSRSEYVDEVYVYLGCTLFFLGMNEQAKYYVEQGAKSELQNRALLLISYKLGDQKELMNAHSHLQADSAMDQMCLAALHYLRQHYTDAIDVYTKILINHDSFVAIYFYLALVQYREEKYELSLEAINSFLSVYADSPVGINLYNCIKYRMGQRAIIDRSTIDNLYPTARLLYLHNSVVFSGGDNALQILPGLQEDVPEAKLNLTIHYLDREDIDSAYRTINDLEPETPTDNLVKAIVYLLIAQSKFSIEHLEHAKAMFEIVGNSNMSDTITGRLANSAYFFLSGLYDDVCTYMSAMKDFFYTDDRFNLNYGQALVMTGRYELAIQVLSLVENLHTPQYYQFFVRAYVMSYKPQEAWDLLLRSTIENDNINLLKIIAHDSYVSKQFASMARAYVSLEKMDPSPEHWIGMRAAVAGQFILLVKGECTGKEMSEVLQYLPNINHSEIPRITSAITKWANDHDIKLSID